MITDSQFILYTLIIGAVLRGEFERNRATGCQGDIGNLQGCGLIGGGYGGVCVGWHQHGLHCPIAGYIADEGGLNCAKPNGQYELRGFMGLGDGGCDLAKYR